MVANYGHFIAFNGEWQGQDFILSDNQQKNLHFKKNLSNTLNLFEIF